METKAYQLSKMLTPIAAALLLALAPYSGAAEKDDHDHEMEQHGSHEHGAARLTIATTDDGLEVSLESPAANVFGFEHKAKTEAEREAIHMAMEKLNDGAALFAVNTAASCVLENVNVEAPSAEGHDEHEHEKEEKHDDHDHEKEEKHDDHDHEKEEKHDDHDHDKHAAEEDSHSDVEAVWTYHCDKPDAIETVAIKLFSAFPKGFEDIDVEWLTAAKAGKVELTEDGTVSLQ